MTVDSSHYTADELIVMLGLHDLELLDLAALGVLQLEADGFTRESVERFQAGLRSAGRGGDGRG